ncbi:hypothetical protein ALC152_10650 [Arcobacter sp. 15-2]|uniref:hypothetical protein n=1 Tax=Arcobacter sp. 15-2 TaxID=3374109 RepID=UPI00399CA117
MSRFFVVIVISILFTTFLSGSVLKEKVENIIGTKDYKIHSSLISLLFKDESKYIINNQIKYLKVFNTLQENGLLNLRLNKPRDIEIEFQSSEKNFKSYKILNDVMHMIGYRYFFTKSMSIDDKQTLTWKILFKAEYMLDPVVLLNELRKNSANVIEVVNKGSNKWFYKIDFKNADLDSAIKIDNYEKVKFQKPLRAYMLKIEEAQSLQVISRNLNNWFPNIVFFDKDLKILKVIKKNRVYKGFKVKIPENTRYVKVTDLYNLINIKRGLSVIVR